MSELVLTLRNAPATRFDASPLVPHRLAGRNADDVRRILLWSEGGESVETGDLFDVTGPPGESLRFVGDLSMLDRLGFAMSAGVLRIEGPAGRAVGQRMTAGIIEVAGDADDGVGMEMSGGQIVVRGSVGRGTGAAVPGSKRGMTGGEIVVFGDAGTETGACMRRGIIAVAGNIGPDAGRAAIAGTIVASGRCEPPSGRWIKRASLIALGDVTIPPAFLYSCTFRPSYVAVLLTHLRRAYGFPVNHEHVSGRYRQYRGDMAELGRGEILHWTGA